MSPVIIAIVGAAGSGKTYMSEFLKSKLNIPVVVSYTTRPMRQGEINGKDHIFISEAEVPSKDKMIAYTIYGNHQYFSLHEQIPADGVCTYVIDEIGLEELTRKFSKQYTVIPVYVQCDEEVLIERGISFDRMQRDKTRRKLDECFYDCIIENNGTVEEFEDKIISEINKL